MKTFLKSALLVLLGLTFLQPSALRAQQSSTGWLTGSGAPSGSCTNGAMYVNSSNGVNYLCSGSAWVLANNGPSLVVATDGTGNYNATGTNDQTPIQNAINAANAAGGGSVYIKHGVYHFSACVTPANSVQIYGDAPSFTTSGTASGQWTPNFSVGTWLDGDGNEDGFCFNTTPSNVPSGYVTANSLQHASFNNLGLTGFKTGIHIGSQNNPGPYWSVFKNIYITGCSVWGTDIENPSEDYFENIQSVYNPIATAGGDILIAGTVNASTYQPGNIELHQIFSQATTNFERGIVFAAPGAESGNASILNSVKVFNAQVNRHNTLTSQTITPTNSSTSISVTDLTKFQVGMPFWVTSSADGYTANIMYFVLSVSGSSGAGTITAGTSSGATTAITATAGTALTLNSYGYIPFEIAGAVGTVGGKSTVNIVAHGLDLEGTSASALLYDEASNQSTYQLAFGSLTNGPSAWVIRGATNRTLIQDYPFAIDESSGTQNTASGARGTIRAQQDIGMGYDSILNSWYMNISNYATGNNPSMYQRGNSQNLTYPARSFGEPIFTQDTTATLSDTKCGLVNVNPASGQTITLPVVDNASTLNASMQGCRYKFVNYSSTNSFTVATQSSQTFNGIASLTSVTVPPNSVLETTATETGSGSNLYWASLTSPNWTLTNCAAVGTSASPSVASCGAASAGQFSCATNATGATCTVNTTAVTANSEIEVFESDTTVTGTRLGVTCNTSTNVLPASRLLASSVAGTSFTINLGTVTTNPACFSYQIIN